MIGTWCRSLRRDAKSTIDEVDRATNGKLDINKIMELDLEIGKMIGRIQERIKDLKRKPDPAYGELLDELGKRHERLVNILLLQGNKTVQTNRTNLIIKCPYQNIGKQEYQATQRINS